MSSSSSSTADGLGCFGVLAGPILEETARSMVFRFSLASAATFSGFALTAGIGA
jgi:hypothetical protein